MIKRKKGSIVYISSSSAIDSNVGRSAYSASKAALISQSKTLSRPDGSDEGRGGGGTDSGGENDWFETFFLFNGRLLDRNLKMEMKFI